ncbi:hypothetical protein LOZ42_001575 [Ophidiomyces ophidiicola]|nr:hypothetical protein LOZ42_001575 [Ophidiomyces ophidiicola]
MPPSTVFSYLRRDHRRLSPSSASPSPSAQTPPQLPAATTAATITSPRLTDALFDAGAWPDLTREIPLDDIPEFTKTPDAELAHNPLPPLPPLAFTDPRRPHSSSGESSAPFANLTNVQRPDHLDGGPGAGGVVVHQKGISSWKRGFGGQRAAAAVPGISAAAATSKGKISDAATTGTLMAGASSSAHLREFKPENAPVRRDEAAAAAAAGAPAGFDTLTEPPSFRGGGGGGGGGKMRFHLLNPMALLARRRSTQYSVKAEDINVSKLTLPALPDDYDPRIRGKLFHDFSAPRPRPSPTMNNNNNAAAAAAQKYGEPAFQTDEAYFSDSSTPTARKSRGFRQRTAFQEDFTSGRAARGQHGELQQQQQQQPGLRTEKIPRAAAAPALDRPLPPILPSQLLEQETPRPGPLRVPVPVSVPVPVPVPVAEKPLPAIRSKPSTVRDRSSQTLSGLPKHLSSTASRFSFDMAGGGSASQERLLEEKHKEKEAARKAKEQVNKFNDFDSEEFDYDAMMDDDGLEERIPGVNADADDFAYGDEFQYEDAGMFNAASPLKSLPITSSFLLSPSSSEGGLSPRFSQIDGRLSAPENHSLAPKTNKAPASTTLPLLTIDTNQPFLPSSPAKQVPQSHIDPVPSHSIGNDDDLYYDDGLFEDLPEDMQDGDFDESIFDNEASHLYERRNANLNKTPPVGSDNQPKTSERTRSLEQDPPVEDTNAAFDSPIAPELNEQAEKELRKSLQELTQGNLQAYHGALAQAANFAAFEGRFERSPSGSEQSSDNDASETEESHPDLTAGQSRHTSQNAESMAFEEVFDDDFNFYDAGDLDDDPMIAAANAEALENDDEGFYGQEFGFYAHSHPHCDGERVLGGYFGSLGRPGIKRNHSARGNFQESLTPITERSEWSTRNSIISLAPPGHSLPSNPSVASPPLSQLVVDMAAFDDEMSFSALMRLRRGAFGGSNGSLRSNATSQTGQSPQSPSLSPMANCGPFSSFHHVLAEQPRRAGEPNAPAPLNPLPLAGSSPPVARRGGDSPPAAAAAAAARNDPTPRPMPSEAAPPVGMESAPAKTRSPDLIRRHVRNNSGAESISYVKETSQSGANCWVLERRRTGDHGEDELLEREVMSSGRI